MIRTVVVNGLHLLECSRCGRRWVPASAAVAKAHKCKATP